MKSLSNPKLATWRLRHLASAAFLT